MQARNAQIWDPKPCLLLKQGRTLPATAWSSMTLGGAVEAEGRWWWWMGLWLILPVPRPTGPTGQCSLALRKLLCCRQK